MIDKIVLDALAVVIKDERVRTQQKLAEFTASLSDEQAKMYEAELKRLDSVSSALEVRIANLHDGEPGKDGDPGRDGEKGQDGKNGEDGKDGAAGRDGIDGAPGCSGDRGANGLDGVNGKDGAFGADGVDGRDGRDGMDGIDRDLVAPFYPAQNDSLERGALAYSQGGLFQAIRKTIGCPETDPGSYRLVINGISDVFYEPNGEGRHTLLHTRMSTGAVHSHAVSDPARIHDEVPEICIDGDVVFTATGMKRYSQGKWTERSLVGPQGEMGIRGRKGLKGEPGPGIEDALIERNHIIVTMTNGVVKSLPLEMPQLPQQVKMQGVHGIAPDDPPVDYLWVTPDGKSKIWSGQKWIKLI